MADAYRKLWAEPGEPDTFPSSEGVAIELFAALYEQNFVVTEVPCTAIGCLADAAASLHTILNAPEAEIPLAPVELAADILDGVVVGALVAVLLEGRKRP
jgi:hypothetical protein